MSPTYGDCDCPLCVPNNPEPAIASPPEEESPVQTEPEPEPTVITPLPKLQLSAIIGNHVAETVTSTVIHPFVNELVRNIGVAKGQEKKTGYYVGAVESVFYGAQALTFLHWNRAADSIGRKPMMLGGTLGTALSVIGFGFSNSFAGVLMSRCAQGAFNGNIGVTSSVMTEITDSTNAAQAFSFLPMARSAGAALGPLIGGSLANPAEKWPGLFKSVDLFKEYPYLLPCLVATATPLAAVVFGSLGLKETLPSLIEKRKKIQALLRRDSNDQAAGASSPTAETRLLPPKLPTASQAYGAITDYVTHNTLPQASGAPAKQANPNVSVAQIVATATSVKYRELLIPSVLIPIINFALLAFLDQSMIVLLPLIYSTPMNLGGLGWTPTKIGSLLSLWSSGNGILQAYCFAWLHRNLGQRSCYMLGLVGLWTCFALFPVLSKLTVWDGDRIGCWVWLGIAIQLLAYMLSHMSYSCISMYISTCAPSKEAASSTNSLSQMTVSGARSLAPTISSSLFAFSLELYHDHGYDFGEYLVYAVLCTLSALALVCSFYLPNTSEDEKAKQLQISD